jgi:hypothetical protein
MEKHGDSNVSYHIFVKVYLLLLYFIISLSNIESHGGSLAEFLPLDREVWRSSRTHVEDAKIGTDYSFAGAQHLEVKITGILDMTCVAAGVAHKRTLSQKRVKCTKTRI